MKNHTMAIFLAAWLLFLAAHAGFSGAPAPAAREAVPEAAEDAPLYRLEPVELTKTFQNSGGKEIASYDYRLLTLAPADKEAPPAEEASGRAAETFNMKMAALMEECTQQGEDMGGYAVQDDKAGFLREAYYDNAAARGTILGEIVSVRVDQNSYTGGAHPNSYTTSYLFDLVAGQFIDPSQLADDPSAFRIAAAEKLVEKAEAIQANREAYWQDYAEIISHWNEGTVVFDEDGMLAVYSTYELGPYAMGAVELRLSWEELSELMGSNGLARLGVELPEGSH